MSDIQLGIYPLTYTDVTDPSILFSRIYPNMERNYYWSDDFSPQFYIAQAKAGFIAVTDTYEGQELLLPEIQFSYALLHFENLHISKKVGRLLRKKHPKLHFTSDISLIAEKIRSSHKQCWLSKRYEKTLIQTQTLREDFQILGCYIEEHSEMVAGEIGYIIGNTYTSLTGFCSREKAFRNYGTTQLVLLAQFLQENGFAFWNLGQSYMPYKFRLGAKQYERGDFLKLWFEHTGV
ncbi:Leucyl/phenylalanyl-tRNA--protein transferase [hydrothermal vent metagenome]|uniref:Leucyl/phenylalanyl-tRNA--protein transferase n=1 Tax=hydrothermal vent metagenome TaxID=652676 RepID=A0A1W1E905_9ZZZZ